MRRDRTLKRGRAVWIIVAGGIGYLLGGWHTATLRSLDLSPAQAVALRFPEDQDASAASDSAPTNATNAAGIMVLGNPRLALLSPAPMVPQVVPQAAVQTTAPEETAALPSPEMSSPRRPAPATVQATVQVRQPVAPAHHRAERPGFMLNDSQIASIKERLRLTPDQERMWPGVEAALRNIAYAKARDAHKHGAPAAELASLGPESAEVQDLKSAAVPLIMSFNDEQKNEVRSLAHVMGLDQLASQF
jgi:hypothetical protein